MFPSLPYNKTDRKKNWANKDPQNCLFFLYTDYVQSVEEAIYLYCAQEVFMETDPTIFYLPYVLIHLRFYPLLLTIASETPAQNLIKGDTPIPPKISQQLLFN